MMSVSNCIVCRKPLSGKQRSFCSVECKNEYFLNYDALKKRAFERKSRLIAVSGGCSRCGYSASLDALSFYDRNGETLHIDTNVLANSNYGKLEERLKNAQVLCRNCYEEVQSTPVSSRPREASGEIPQEILRDSSATVGMTGIIAGMTAKFEQNLTHCGVKSGQTIVLGVSGGVDSMTMLDLFVKSELKLNIIVAHMNHGIREEAVKDEKLVAKLAKKHGFKFVSKTITQPTGGNLEENLRNERRKFLLDAANNNKANLVALAHNADDQAETFIMNAVRGSGPAGLGAMSMSERKLIRPLLNFSRSEIEYYAKENKLDWHEDVTNQDTSYNRNYVRHRILPLLSRLNPEYLEAIERTTGLQRQIDDHFKEEALYVIARSASDVAISSVSAGKDCFVPRNDGVSCESLRRLDKPLLYEALGILYEEVKGDRQNLSLAHLSATHELIQTGSGTKTLDLPDNVVVRRRYDKLDFYAEKEHNTASAPSTKKLKIGIQKFGNWEITVAPTNYQSLFDNTKYDLAIGADTLPNLQIRTRCPGDKIASLGAFGTKKLQDLFVDAKIDRVKRTVWPILADSESGKILWVPGLAKAKIRHKTKKLLKINVVEVEHETTK